MDGVHDLGGMHGFRPVPIEVDEPLFHERWEGRVWAMHGTVMAHTTIDRFRYTIERMPPAEYLASSYYERWLWAIEQLAAEQHLIDRDDAPRRVTRLSPATAPDRGRFAVDDPVRVGNPVTDGHTRVPRYLRGHVGRVERVAFAWPNPGESAASGGVRRAGSGVHRRLRRVRPVRRADHIVTADLGDSDLEEP